MINRRQSIKQHLAIRHIVALRKLLRLRQTGCLVTSALPFVVAPGVAHAHSAERGLVMLLPTGFYMAGGAIAVAASFAVLAFLPARMVEAAMAARLRLLCLPLPSAVFTSLLSFVILSSLVIIGSKGGGDPLTNPLPLAVWTLFWVLFTLTQFLVGNLWPGLNPFTGPAMVARRGLRLVAAPLTLPGKFGYAIAIGQFVFFSWFELVDPAPDNPDRLAVVVLVYWLVNFAGVVLFGQAQWFKRCEPFAVFFRIVGHCAPLGWEFEKAAGGRRRLTGSLRWPGAGLVNVDPMPPSGIAFLLLTLSAVSFDGFSRTFLWLGAIGVNPLEFPGRSAVIAANSAGLFAAWIVLAGLFFACIYAGNHAAGMAGEKIGTMAAAGHLAYSIVPISMAFHFAHYLTALLVNGQYALVALADPFARGWNLTGFANFHVTTSFLNNISDVARIWSAQTVMIIVGHVIGIIVAHAIAVSLTKTVTQATLSQSFLAALMVFYTVFGLWLLSTPTAL